MQAHTCAAAGEVSRWTGRTFDLWGKRRARDMADEGCRAAALDGRHHLQLVKADMAGRLQSLPEDRLSVSDRLFRDRPVLRGAPQGHVTYGSN
jgi:hypothetical protein